MRTVLLLGVVWVLCSRAWGGVIVLEQPAGTGGTLYQSSGNGSDYDKYVYDDFVLSSPQEITEIRWRGGYDPQVEAGGYGRPVADFSIGIWRGLAVPPAFAQPDIGAGAVAFYDLDTGIGNANEAYVGDFGGGAFGPTKMYDYSYVLPTSFIAEAGQEYWICIGAFQAGIPDWGFAAGLNGNSRYYGTFINYAGGTNGRLFTGDAAFSLVGVPEPGSLGVLGAGICALLRRRRQA